MCRALLQGLGAAFIMPLSLSLISSGVPARRARQGARHLVSAISVSAARVRPG